MVTKETATNIMRRRACGRVGEIAEAQQDKWMFTG